MKALVLLSAGRHPVSGKPGPPRVEMQAARLAGELDPDAGGLHAGVSCDSVREALGRGLSHLTHLTLDVQADPVPALVAALKAIGPDVVLAGPRGEGGEDSGLVPYALAHALGWPLVAHAVAVAATAGGVSVTQAAARRGAPRNRLADARDGDGSSAGVRAVGVCSWASAGGPGVGDPRVCVRAGRAGGRGDPALSRASPRPRREPGPAGRGARVGQPGSDGGRARDFGFPARNRRPRSFEVKRGRREGSGASAAEIDGEDAGPLEAPAVSRAHPVFARWPRSPFRGKATTRRPFRRRRPRGAPEAARARALRVDLVFVLDKLPRRRLTPRCAPRYMFCVDRDEKSARM